MEKLSLGFAVKRNSKSHKIIEYEQVKNVLLFFYIFSYKQRVCIIAPPHHHVVRLGPALAMRALVKATLCVVENDAAKKELIFSSIERLLKKG